MNKEFIFTKQFRYCDEHPEKLEKFSCSCGKLLCENCLNSECYHNHKEMAFFLLNNERDVFRDLLENFIKKNSEYQKLSNFSLDELNLRISTGLKYYFFSLLQKEIENINYLLKKKCKLFQTNSKIIRCEDVYSLKQQAEKLDHQIYLSFNTCKEKRNEISANFNEKFQLIFSDILDVLDFHILNKKSLINIKAEKSFKKKIKQKIINKITRNNHFFYPINKTQQNLEQTKKNEKLNENFNKVNFDPIIKYKVDGFENSELIEVFDKDSNIRANNQYKNLKKIFTTNDIDLPAFYNNFKNNNLEESKNSNLKYELEINNYFNDILKFKKNDIKIEKSKKDENEEDKSKNFQANKELLISDKKNILINKNNDYKINQTKIDHKSLHFSKKKGFETDLENNIDSNPFNEYECKIQSENIKTFIYKRKDKSSKISVFETEIKNQNKIHDSKITILNKLKKHDFTEEIKNSELTNENMQENDINRNLFNTDLQKYNCNINIFENSQLKKISKNLNTVSPKVIKGFNKQYLMENESNSKENLFQKADNSNQNISLELKNKFSSDFFSETDTTLENLNNSNDSINLSNISLKTNIEIFTNKISKIEDIYKIDLSNNMNDKVNLKPSNFSKERFSALEEKNRNMSKNLEIKNEDQKVNIVKIKKLNSNLDSHSNYSSNGEEKFLKNIFSHKDNYIVNSKKDSNSNDCKNFNNLKKKLETKSEILTNNNLYYKEIYNSQKFNKDELEAYNHDTKNNIFNKLFENQIKNTVYNNYRDSNFSNQSDNEDMNKNANKTPFFRNEAKIEQLLNRKKGSSLKVKNFPKRKKIKKYFTNLQVTSETKVDSKYLSYYDKLASLKEPKVNIYSLIHHPKCIYNNKNITLKAAKCICLKQLLGIGQEKIKSQIPSLSTNGGGETANQISTKVQVRCEDCKMIFVTPKSKVHYRKKCLTCFEKMKLLGLL